MDNIGVIALVMTRFSENKLDRLRVGLIDCYHGLLFSLNRMEMRVDPSEKRCYLILCKKSVNIRTFPRPRRIPLSTSHSQSVCT